MAFAQRATVFSDALAQTVVNDELSDPDDDHVIAAAITRQADPIASGAKCDLLPLGSFEGIPIITAREAVERLEARSETLSLKP